MLILINIEELLSFLQLGGWKLSSFRLPLLTSGVSLSEEITSISRLFFLLLFTLYRVFRLSFPCTC